MSQRTKQIKSLNLKNSIVFFDVETTGLDIGNDRIVSIAVSKIMPDGETESKYTLINPLIPISKEASEIHGIKNEDVTDKPTFKQISKSLYEFMNGSYLAGYNNNFFDNAILQEEFLRCGIDYPPNDVVSIDVCAIFKNYEKRDLSSALKFYCNKEMENAHNAEADISATIDVFLAQTQKYEELKNKPIEEIALVGKNTQNVDFQGKIIKNKDGDYCWNFGKVKGRKIKHELDFGNWVLTTNFPQSFKNLVAKIISGYNKK